MVNERAIVEAFSKIKQEFQEIRAELNELKEKLEELSTLNNHTEIIEEDRITQEKITITKQEKATKEDIEETIDLSDSYY